MKNLVNSSYVADELDFDRELKQEASILSGTEKVDNVVVTTEMKVSALVEFQPQLDFKSTMIHNLLVAVLPQGDKVFLFVNSMEPTNWSPEKVQVTQEASIFDTLTDSEFKNFSRNKSAGNTPLLKFYEDKGNTLYYLSK